MPTIMSNSSDVNSTREIESHTAIADQEKLDEVIVIGSSPSWWSGHRQGSKKP